jgi:hypothetical protein
MRLFAVFSMMLWLWKLIYHTMFYDVSIWLLFFYLVMLALSIALYESTTKEIKNEKDIEEKN